MAMPQDAIESVSGFGWNESTLRKVQAVATIGSGIVALHGITSRRWQKRHTLFMVVGMGTSVGLAALAMAKKGGAPTNDG
jgi:hypothetical protein